MLTQRGRNTADENSTLHLERYTWSPVLTEEAIEPKP